MKPKSLTLLLINLLFASVLFVMPPFIHFTKAEKNYSVDAIVVWQHQDVLLELPGWTFLFDDWDIWYSIWDDSLGVWWTPTGNHSAPLASMDGDDIDPAIAFDDQGNALVVWAHNTSSDYDIWYSRWNGSGWEPPTSVDKIPGHDTDPAIAYDINGQALVLWIHDNKYVYYARWDGAGWTRGAKITAQWPQSFNGSYLPEITFTSLLAPNGSHTARQALAIWTQMVEEPSRLISRIYYSLWDGDEWSLPEAIPDQIENATSNGFSSTYRNGISSDKNGNAIAVWATASETKPVFYAMWNGTTGSWSSTVSLEAQNITGVMPAVAFDSFNGAILTYTGITPDGWLDIRYSRWLKKIGWSNSSLAADSTESDWRSSFAFCSSDRGVVVWWIRHPDFTNTEIFYSVWDPITSSWTEAASLVGDVKPPFPSLKRLGLEGNDINPAIASTSGSPTMPHKETRDVAVIDVKPLETIVSQNSSTAINVTVENQGTLTETFNVTAYYNSTAIATLTVANLTSASRKTLTFIWNTTNVALGNYTISAQATAVLHEIDLTDNNFTNGNVEVTILYTLTITTTTGGTTDPSPGNYTYETGTVVNIAAIAHENYTLDHWELDGVDVGNPNPINVTMDANHDLHAVFVSTLDHDVAIINLTASPIESHVGQTVYINVTVENQGCCTENFTVSVYYIKLRDPLIGEQNVTLTAGANMTLTFEWIPNETGRYKIRAEASAVEGEVDTADNSREIKLRVKNSQISAQSNSSVTNLTVFLIGIFSIILVAPKLSEKKGLFLNPQQIHLTHKNPASIEQKMLLEQTKRSFV
jgi:hypothetical protein